MWIPHLLSQVQACPRKSGGAIITILTDLSVALEVTMVALGHKHGEQPDKGRRGFSPGNMD